MYPHPLTFRCLLRYDILDIIVEHIDGESIYPTIMQHLNHHTKFGFRCDTIF